MPQDSGVPFRQFVLKMHARCDLACDHCYVYEHQDVSWQAKPVVVSEQVLERTAQRIAEHARQHGLEQVNVVLHGGEPLLAGTDRLRRAAEELQHALTGVCALDLRIHTNGVTLAQRHLDLFHEYRIKVGISLDGDRAANDLHRRYANGRSSHDKVLRAVDLLRRPEHRELYAGLLCTIDVRNDPVAVYDALAALEPPRIDFLLPHATWEQPPLRPAELGETPYADWLLTIYRRWQDQGRPMPVRLFDSLHRTLRGLNSLTESLGLAPADLVVIETDGTLEQADSLKTAFDGAPATGFDVFRHDLDTAARHPGMIDRQQGLAGLSKQCQACPVVKSCGGGLYAHRFRADSGFDNPSVFCEDLLRLVTAVKESEMDHSLDGLLPHPVNQFFDEFASGYGGSDALAALAEAELEVNRALLDRLLARQPELEADDAWQAIAALDASAPAALDRVLAHPYLRPWARRCLSGKEDARAGLAEIAAAAAVTAGAAVELELPLRQDVLRLPTLGVLHLEGVHKVRVRTEQGGFVADTGPERISVRLAQPAAEPRWAPVRQVAVAGRRLALEDTDPERESHGHAAAPRLDEPEVAAWAAQLGEAYAFVRRELPGYADGLAAGLGTVTPLEGGPEGRAVSSASRHAFGAVAAARPDEADYLALLLVHEFQHVKLGALFDLYDLFDPADDRRYVAPWRPDLRPFEGLLQGTYAHIAVAEYWRAKVRIDPRDAHARGEFDRWLRHTHEALLTMADSGTLTPLGERFVAGMRATVEPWLAEAGE